MKPWTKLQLDLAAASGCDVPNCPDPHEDGVIYFHGRCHPLRPVQASYKQGSGVVQIACGECRKLIVEIAVGGP